MIIWRMPIARRLPNATNTHSEYVILIAFALQQWLQERAAMLRHSYIKTETERVYCAVRTSSLDVIEVIFLLYMVKGMCLEKLDKIIRHKSSVMTTGLLSGIRSGFIYHKAGHVLARIALFQKQGPREYRGFPAGFIFLPRW